MTSIIQIEGDLVRTLKTEVVDEVRLQDFLPNMEYRPPILAAMLPRNMFAMFWDESDPKHKRVQVVAELGPGVRTCNYLGEMLAVSLPWTYFIFTFTTTGDPLDGSAWMNENVQIYWAREAVKDMDSEIGTALVPNCDTEGQICWGSTGVDNRQTLRRRIDQTIEEFYRTEFTHDSGTGSPWGQTERHQNAWNKWVEETTRNPAAFLDFPEWDGKGFIRLRPLRSVVGKYMDRAEPIKVEGVIQGLKEPFTFGTAEEWLQSSELGATKEQRETNWVRLETAITNLRAERDKKK